MYVLFTCTYIGTYIHTFTYVRIYVHAVHTYVCTYVCTMSCNTCMCISYSSCAYGYVCIVYNLHLFFSFVKECIDLAFDKANDYASRFEPYREFYQSNEELDIEKMEEEDHGKYNTMHVYL